MDAPVMATAQGQGGSTTSLNSLAYVEPHWTLVLVLAAFLLALNVLHGIFDALVYAGLLGQLVLGALLGTPLAAALPRYVEKAVQDFGYLGLLLLIARGGVETRLDILSTPGNLTLAMLVGLTGIGAPIALSFAVLGPAFSYTPRESFALGASLSATSLGTAFAVIDAVSSGSHGSTEAKEESVARENRPPSDPRDAVESGNGHPTSPQRNTEPRSSADHHRLSSTRIATLLVGAALLDDIVGLVLAAVISNLGASDGASPNGWALARPVVASAALILATALIARLVGAALSWAVPVCASNMVQRRRSSGFSWPHPLLSAMGFCEARGETVGVLAFVGLLCALVAIAHAIGSTMLLGAFCAGAFSKYAHDKIAQSLPAQHAQRDVRPSISRLAAFANRMGPEQALHQIRGVSDYVLIPFFFASIGFAVPLRSLFQGPVLWKGWVYACLMAFAKVLPGIWILAAEALRNGRRRRHASGGSEGEVPLPGHAPAAEQAATPRRIRRPTHLLDRCHHPSIIICRGHPPWQPALLLGLCLVSRGEVGFIIINLARQSSILASDEAFNVGVWAIVLNTLFGPLAVGFLLRANGGAVASQIVQGPWGAVGR